MAFGHNFTTIFSPLFHDKILRLGVFSIHPNPDFYDELSLTLADTEVGEFISNKNNYPSYAHFHSKTNFGQMKTGYNKAILATLLRHEIVHIKRLPDILLSTYI